MKKNKLVSIIVPCYNQAQYLEEAVQSAVDQSYKNIEVIIVNDGSPDNTQEVAEELQKKHPSIIRIVKQKNQGLPVARNAGIKESLGEYILPLDADDILDLNAINQCMDLMIQTNADIIHGALQCFGESHDVWLSKPFSENNILYENLPHQTSLYRKKVWTKTKGYKKNMKGYADWEFWINAYKHNFTFHYLPVTLYYYRIKKESMYTESFKKDAYLKAKITLNNPELYTINWVQKAILTIREAEEAADFYFYYSKGLSINKASLLEGISYFLTSHQLEERQLITIPNTNKKVGLYALNILDNRKQLKQIYKETEADFILFYTSLRYEVPPLKNLDFAWDKDKGMIETHGTVFPFVFKSKREDNKLQLIAYQKELKYIIYKSRINAEAAKKKLVSLQRKCNVDKKTAGKRLDRLQHKYNMDMETTRNKLDTITDRYNLIMESISNLSEIPGKAKPLQKISAYKALIKTYFELRKDENEKK